MVKSYTLFLFLLFASFFLNAQNLIDGVVIDAKTGESIIGAAIMVKDSDEGDVSDIDGTFEVEAEIGDYLVISFIGYATQEVLVTEEKFYTIILEEASLTLEEVVVVGYGVQRKVDVTGATVSVKGEELARQPVMTATQALQGKVTGVQIMSSGKPGSSPSVRVRGTSTALAGTSALFVVDGVLTDDISNINTADILSMDVLKDASSTAIYGARGANGVIIITTKKGEEGATRINYNNFVGFRSAAHVVEMANSREYANYATAATGQDIEEGDVDTDWFREILRNAMTQNHNLSISGGNEKITHFLGVGYLNEEGIVLNNAFTRFDIRANLDYKLNNYLNVGLNSSYSTADEKDVNLGTAYNNAYRAAPIIPGKVGDRYGNTSQYQNVGNPILDLNDNDIKNLLSRLQASAYVEIKPLTGLSYRSMLGTDRKNINGRTYNYQFLNNEETFLTAGGNQRNLQSNLFVRNEYNSRWVWDNILTYEKGIGAHYFTILAGTTAEAFNAHWFTASRKEVPANKDLWYINTGDANTSTNAGGGDAWARNSYLGRINYNYNHKYLFTGTLRRDGSSRIAEENRWGIFPSVGLGWVVSNEKFLANVRFIDNLKLRGSWGKVGNDRVPSDAFTETVTPNLAYPFGGGVAIPGSAITQIKDPHLKWETTEELDFGIDYSFINGKLYGELGYYTKTTRDLLINIKIPATVGDEDGVILTNAASIRNSGWEGTINYRNRVSSKLTYRVGVNVTLNKNKVIGLNGGEPILDGGIGAGQIYTTRTDNGHPVGSFYVYQVLGVFQDRNDIDSHTSADGTIIQPDASPGDFIYMDLNGDGKIDDQDRVFVGSYQPKAYFGLNADISYGAFELSFDIYGNVGNKIYNGKKALRLSGLDNVEKTVAHNRWYAGSGIQDEPIANSGYLPASTYYVESGDFIRLNNVSLAYNLPEGFTRRLRIEGAKIFVTGQNLATWKKFTGFSPELSSDSPTSSGIELNAYPVTRTIGAGINVNF